MKNYKSGRPSYQKPPKSPGEYRYINKETNEVEYIGETNNLYRREYQHECSDKSVSRETHRFGWKDASSDSTSESRREHESSKIKQHNPVLNKRAGGGGRKAN